MRSNRLLSALLAALLALSLAPAAFAAPAEQAAAAAEDAPAYGRVPEERGPAPFRGLGRFRGEEPAAKLPGQPRNDVIEDVPLDPNDASIPLNLIPYHDIPPKLRELQQSDRISVEIIGKSVEGRDLHLVVATAPMTDAEWNEWQRLSDLRTDDPEAAIAALQAGGYDAWKSPLMINNNIHGNEWEGTDASLQVLDELAFSDDPDILKLLDEHLLVFIVTMNPDGRVNATRANTNGFDMNRDHITQSQPEVRIFRDNLIRYDPLTFLDQHGYVQFTLIEPTTGPHGENYEYDLYFPNALSNALAMEQAVLATGEPTRVVGGQLVTANRIDIPFRNRFDGWDDWPPIFTPMYAMYHGVVGHTVEFPLNPRGIANVANRHERTRINTAIARATIESNFAWANENRLSVLGDQLEMYRRGANGESSRPLDDPRAAELVFPGSGSENTFLIDFPRAYVIPVGTGQRSATAAARLVQHLIDNDVKVHQARVPVTVGGTRYAAGSYVVDMHQAKRGLANTMLDIGRDISQDFARMYDISAWSQAALWGATVDRFEAANLNPRQLVEVSKVSRTGSVAPGNRATYGLTVDSVNGVQAVNALLERGVSLQRLPDGTFVVGGNPAAVREVAAETGVSFTVLPPARVRGAVPFDSYRIGVSAFSDEIFAFQRMGFEITPVTHTGFNNGTYAFGDFDAFYVGTGAFNPESLDATQQQAFTDWLEAGGTVVMRTGNGLTFNGRANLLDITVATAPAPTPDGIVAVDNDPDSPITGSAIDTAFINGPRLVTAAGEDVRFDQRIVDDPGFFLAGHWRNGQALGVGQGLVVSGPGNRGGNAVFFGSEPLYRAHPEGMFVQVAEALWWDGS
jgi:rhodanese-related sulfurtransferase